MANDTTILKTVWNGDATGKGNIKTNCLETDITIPKHLGGNGEVQEPKEILIASATACFTMTLTGMLQGRKLLVEQITMDTESTKSKEEGFKIIHSPHIILSAGTTDEQIQTAHKAIELAKKRCEAGTMLRQADGQIQAKRTVSVS